MVALVGEIGRLEKRVDTLRSALRLYILLARLTGATLANRRAPRARDKVRVLRAVAAVEPALGRRAALRILGLGRVRLSAWTGRARECALEDAPPCPRAVPGRLTAGERRTMRMMVEADEYKHLSLRSLALLAQRTRLVFASYQTWCRMVSQHCWRRPRRRLYPTKPRVGIRAANPGELLHVDVTIIRLLDQSRAYLHGVVDNFSRKVLAWSLEASLSAGTTRKMLLEAIRQIHRTPGGINVMTDGGSENLVFGADEELSQVAERVVAQVDVAASNSMVESLWSQLRHRWLYLHNLDSFATLERLIAKYVADHNTLIPKSALHGRTPDEAFLGLETDLRQRLSAKHAIARRRRLVENRARLCASCSPAM